MSALDRLTDALRQRDCTPRAGAGGQWTARCPAHADRTPSLSLRQIEGQALLHCHAGCDTTDVLAALGLRLADLYDQPRGVAYRYDDGRIVHRTPDKRFRQSGHTQGGASLYRLGKVSAAVAAGRPVYLCEGEKDVHALESVGVVATTSPMGAANWSKVDPSPLTGATVVLVADHDKPGRYAAEAKTSLDRLGATVSMVTAQVGKDAADHIAAGHGPQDFMPVPIRAAPDTGAPLPAPGETWQPVELGEVVAGLLSGRLTRPAPTVGVRQDGVGLFYPGKVNGVAGASGTGKSWTALYASAQQLDHGRHVVYVDFEDDAAGVVARLLDLGVSPQVIPERLHYLRPDEAYSAAAAGRLAETITAYAPALVIIDSTGESMALDGARPHDDDDTARWFRRLPTAIARRGPAVVVLDHAVKADGGGLWPIGSQRKRAAISGAQYMQTIVESFAKNLPGAARLVCAKDRHGTYRPGQQVAELAVTPTGDGVRLALTAPHQSDGEAGRGVAHPTASRRRPTAHLENVSRLLEAATQPLSFRQIDKQVPGKQEHVTRALDVLVAEGYVRRVDGPRRSQLHSSVRPYRPADGPMNDLQPLAGDSAVSGECVTVSAPRNGGRETDTPPSPGDGGETLGRQWGVQRPCEICQAPVDAGPGVVCDRCPPVLAPGHGLALGDAPTPAVPA